MNKSVINDQNKKVIGWQSEESFSNSLIHDYPFEVILHINSIKGRIIVLSLWRDLVSHSNFVYQTNYKNVFGFIIDSKETETKHCGSIDCFNNSVTREMQIELISKIEKKIHKIKTKLLPFLYWRLLVKRKLIDLQGKGYFIEENKNCDEENKYLIFVVYMYFYSFLKYANFNPVEKLRLKLTCNRCISSGFGNCRRVSCICCYGMNEGFIKETKIQENKRSSILCEDLCTRIKENIEEECFEFKEESINEVNETFKRELHDENWIKIGPKKAKIKIKNYFNV